MKKLLILVPAFLLASAVGSLAQTIYLKRGDSMEVSNVKRNGDSITYVTRMGAGEATLSVQISTIDHIAFKNNTALPHARDLVFQGKEQEAVQELGPLLTEQAHYKGIPGNLWSEAAILEARAYTRLGRFDDAQPLVDELSKATAEPDVMAIGKLLKARIVAVKAANRLATITAPEMVGSAPIDAKPVDPKAPAKPTDAKTADAKVADAKAGDAKAPDAKSGDNVAEAKPGTDKSDASKPGTPKPSDPAYADLRNAIETYDSVLKDTSNPDVAAEAWYYKGDALTLLKERESAVLALLHVSAFYANSPFMPKVLYEASLQLEKLKDEESAHYYMNSLVTQYPTAAESASGKTELRRIDNILKSNQKSQ